MSFNFRKKQLQSEADLRLCRSALYVEMLKRKKTFHPHIHAFDEVLNLRPGCSEQSLVELHSYLGIFASTVSTNDSFSK